MKAAVIHHNGGPDVLHYEDLPDPVCADDGIVIDLETCPSKAAIQLAHRAGATVIATALQAEYPRAHALVADCLTRVASGELRVKIAEVFAISQAAQMHTYLEGRDAFGRVVMTM